MRDLKYLSYFENLLREANNALIIQAKKEGKVCVAFVCENTPEPLLNLDGTCFLSACPRRTPARWILRPII